MREMTPIDLFSVFSVPSVADFRSKVQGPLCENGKA